MELGSGSASLNKSYPSKDPQESIIDNLKKPSMTPDHGTSTPNQQS
jgi:hypothetical protein